MNISITPKSFRIGICITLFLFPLTVGLHLRAAVSEPADLILTNGKVWTVDEHQPVAQAVALRGTKIVKVGNDREVLVLKGEKTQIIDLQGRLVLPGFNDAHTESRVGSSRPV